MKGKRAAAIAALAAAVIALLVVVMPRIASGNTAGTDEAAVGNVSSTENVNPTENISAPEALESDVKPAGPNEGTMENVDPTVGTLPRYYGFAVRAVCE